MRYTTPVLTAAALLAIGGCGAATRAAVAPTATLTSAATGGATITTTGTGTASGSPDLMSLQIGVQVTRPHVAAALQADNVTSAAVQAALVRQGVAVGDIQTTGLSVYPQQGRSGAVTGYQVSDTVSATIRHLSRAGTSVENALAAAGDSGRLDGVSFSIADQSPLLAKARANAVTAARSDAQQIAAAAGLHLVGLRSMVDQTNESGSVTQSTFSVAGGVAPAAPVPVQGGTQQSTVQVTAVWAVGA